MPKMVSLPTPVTAKEARKLAKDVMASLPPQAQAVLNDHGSIITIDTVKGRIFSAGIVGGKASVMAAEGLIEVKEG